MALEAGTSPSHLPLACYERLICSRYGSFTLIRFTEADSSALALRAQQIQARSYLARGFITDAGIDADGRLPADLDGCRGPHVTYWMAIDRHGDPAASCRLVRPDPGVGLASLPSWPSFRTAMYDADRLLVENAHSDASIAVSECGALCHEPHATPLATYVVLREVIQTCLRAAPRALWTMSLTEASFTALQASFGTALRLAGRQIPPEPDSARVTPLVPAHISITGLPELLLADIESASDPAAAHRFARTLSLLTHDLPDEHLRCDATTALRIRDASTRAVTL